jgi:glycerol kinase
MAWLRRTLTTEGVVTTTDTWLVWHLTGNYVTDAPTASRSLLTRLDTDEWDPDLLSLFELSDERLPAIVVSDEIVGMTREFSRPAPVAGLILDQPAALAAEACLEAGTAKCTFGTGAFLLANSGQRAARSASGLTTSVAWRARGRTLYCLDGQVYTAASAVRWIQELGLIRSAADLDQAAAEERDGTLCVPALAGLCAPWWRSDATASFTGMTVSTTPGHLVLALIQGIAAQVADLADLMRTDLGAPLTRLRADAGLTRSRVLMQATADLMQVPVEVYPSPNATGLGAAALGRLAIEPALDLPEAILDSTPADCYEPIGSADRATDYRARWRRLLLWTDDLVYVPHVTATQDGRVIGMRRLPWPSSPGRVFRVPWSLLSRVDPAQVTSRSACTAKARGLPVSTEHSARCPTGCTQPGTDRSGHSQPGTAR